MTVATQYCVCLENKPGMLARLCGVLSQAKVNIEAMFVSQGDEEGFCWVNFVATPAREVESALTEASYSFVPEKVLTVQLENRPGELARIADRLAEAQVNIHYVYGGGVMGSRFLAVLSVEDMERSAGVLREAR